MADKLVENKLTEIESSVKCYIAALVSRKKRLNRRDYTSRAVFSVIDYCYWFQSKFLIICMRFNAGSLARVTVNIK